MKKLLKNILNWITRNDYPRSLYVLEESDLHPEHFVIKLVRGKYAGVSYWYTNACISEENTHVKLSYGYTLYDNANHVGLNENPEFNHLLGDILVNIISTKSAKKS
jgi:hypothetical protein